MSIETCQPCFQRLFGLNIHHGFCVGVALDDGATGVAGDPDTAAPHPGEAEAALGMASDARRLSYCGGRAALHAALEACDLHHDEPVSRADSGAPLLPSGVLGSISHTRGLAAAIVRPDTDEECSPPSTAGAGPSTRLTPSPSTKVALGLDVEHTGRAFNARAARRILTDAELHLLAGATGGGMDDDGFRRAVLLRFSLKEAFYKAVAPLGAVGLGFRAVSIAPGEDGTAATAWSTVELQRANGDIDVELRWYEIADFFVTTAEGRRRPRGDVHARHCRFNGSRRR